MSSPEKQQEELRYLVQEIAGSDKPRLLIVLPGSAGDIFLSTSILQSLKEDMYNDYDIYYACNPVFHGILKNNPYIHKVLNYCSIMDQPHFMEGFSDWWGLFDISLQLHILTQMVAGGYMHNGKDKNLFDFKAKGK